MVTHGLTDRPEYKCTHAFTHARTHDELGVYTMAFLSVMAFFAMGTLVLRIKRPDLQRPFVCPLCVDARMGGRECYVVCVQPRLQSSIDDDRPSPFITHYTQSTTGGWL